MIVSVTLPNLTGATGAQGATGAAGPQGPAGPPGPAGQQVSDSLLLMLEGATPPDGYLLIGTFVEARVEGGTAMRVTIWRKQ